MGGMGMMGGFGGMQAVPLSMMNEDQLRAALKQQGKSTKGNKELLLARLMTAANDKAGQGPAKRQKGEPRKKVPLTQEQIDAMPEEHRKNYLAKQAKKAENLERQKQMLVQHRNEAKDRQEREVIVKIDLAQIKAEVQRSMASYGAIEALKYDSLKNEFVVRFAQAKSAKNIRANSSLNNPRQATLEAKCLIHPQTVNVDTVFFVDPTHPNHPQAEEVKGLLKTKGVDEKLRWPSKEPSQVFMNEAEKQFAKFGKISGVFRERGFICVTYAKRGSAQKAESNCQNATLFGIGIGTLSVGIPKKGDKKRISALLPRSA